MRGLIAFVLVAGAFVAPAAAAIPVAVDKASASDALSKKLLKAIEFGLRSSPRFALTDGRDGGTLLITLEMATTELVRERKQVTYRVRFVMLPGRGLGTNLGVCWENELADCADQVTNSAQVQLSVNQP